MQYFFREGSQCFKVKVTLSSLTQTLLPVGAFQADIEADLGNHGREMSPLKPLFAVLGAAWICSSARSWLWPLLCPGHVLAANASPLCREFLEWCWENNLPKKGQRIIKILPFLQQRWASYCWVSGTLITLLALMCDHQGVFKIHFPWMIMLGKEGVTALNFSELTRAIWRLRAVREGSIIVIFDVYQQVWRVP